MRYMSLSKYKSERKTLLERLEAGLFTTDKAEIHLFKCSY